MLEIRNIDKTYTPKRGKPVHALNNVSLKFDEKGMVFILGKSGCGKSTLLNVIGGLDKFDSGEIIIKGKSSNEFSGSDFDSYRNTFVGFIFQEYNILSEFNIAKNIALAMELQGKKATPEKVQELLDMVDLGAQGNRKTTELSGGQKQRVAIARALIKDPEIIIADEPTGALDSATGAQVFDTLKKLSKDKLVIIVSHDREYAETYADRIIEMKDGNVISDDTKRLVEPKSVANNIDLIGENIIRIAPGHTVTKEEVEDIVKILNKTPGEKIISCNQDDNDKFKKISNISEEGKTEIFTKTQEEDFDNIQYDKSKLKFIKSKLRLRDSFKMGASGLKNKPFRLIMTIFLSLVSFSMFGLADTFASYNKIDSTTQSFIDSNYRTLCFSGQKRENYEYIDGDGNKHVEYYYNDSSLSQSQVNLLKEKTGLEVKPIYTPGKNNFYYNNYLYDENAIVIGTSNGSYFSGISNGFVEFSNNDLELFECDLLAGRLPINNEEIAISKYSYELFDYCGIKYNGESLTLGDLSSYIYKHEDTNGNGKLDLDELSKIDIYNDSYRTMSSETEFLSSGKYYVTKYIDLSSAKIDDFILITEENLDWSSSSSLNNPNSIKIIFDHNFIKKPEEINSYNDIIGGRLSYYNYDISKQENYTIVGVVDTKFDDSNYLDIKEKSINKTLGSMSSQDYTKMSVFNDLLEYSLHTSTFVAPGFIEDHLNPMLSVNNISDDYIFVYKYYQNNGGILEWTQSRIYFSKTTRYNPADVAFMNGYTASKLELEDNEFVIDFRVAMQAIDNYFSAISYDKGDEVYNSPEYHLYSQYYEKLHNPLQCKELLDDSNFRQWLLSYSDKYSIGSAHHPEYTYDDSLLEIDTRKKVVGLYMHSTDEYFDYNNYDFAIIGSEKFLAQFGEGVFSKVISTMPASNEDLKNLIVNYYEDEDSNDLLFKFRIRNSVMSSLDFVNNFIEETSKIFLYIGIGFSVFAGLMLANFISISITYKKREIGILRAIGARKKDVFSIFFNESSLIAFINFVLTVITTGVACYFINNSLRLEAGFNITLLIFGPRQIILTALLSFIVALLASALPVYRIARKQPIDAINNR